MYKNRLHIVAFCISIIGVWACGVDNPVASEGSREQSLQALDEDPCLEEGELIIEFTDDFCAKIESGEQDAELSEIGVSSLRRLYPDAGQWEPRHRAAGLHRWYVAQYNPSTTTRTKAKMSLEGLDGVVYVEPSRKAASCAIFNDPGFSRQWNLNDINLVPVWRHYTAGSSDVVVAVVDGGIDLCHEDLAGACLPGGENGSKNFCTGYEGYDIIAHPHGTHVAGIIGAVNNNGKGMCGLAGGQDGNAGVKLMSCQIFMTNPQDPGADDIGGNSYNAIVWAADHGALICQNSWSYKYKTEQEAAAGGVGAIKHAIDYFTKNAGCDIDGNQVGLMKGGLVIFAAGNDGFAHGWPAEYEPCLAVGAADPSGNRAYYSNYGDWVDIAAPGGDYHVAQIYSALPGNDYGYMQGTSMACPHVSGVAALLVSYYGGPGFTSQMLREKLICGADPSFIAPGAKIGAMLDALGSITYGTKEAPSAVEQFDVEVWTNTLNLSWTVGSDPDDKVPYAYSVLLSKKASDLESLDMTHLPSSVRKETVLVSELSFGQAICSKIEGLDYLEDYYVAIVAFDYAGNYSALSPIKKVSTNDNYPPEIVKPIGNHLFNSVGERMTLHLDEYFKDPDGERLSFSVENSSKDAMHVNLAGNVLNVTAIDYGLARIDLVATDSRNQSCALSFKLLLKGGDSSIDIYPNPVKKDSEGKAILYVSPDDEAVLLVRLTNQAGREVARKEGKCDPFNPLELDMSSLAAGKYRIELSHNGELQERSIVKL